MIDRKAYFARIRQHPFNGSLTQGQVDGISAILDEWERRQLSDGRWLDYMMATAFHETGTLMQPVIETRQAHELTNPSVDEAIRRLENAWAAGKMPWVKSAYWRKDASGMSWLGRGLPQVTHKPNYTRAEKEMGVPFTSDPSLMLQMKYAVPVMFNGMIKGWFTGDKLSDYFNSTTEQPRLARQIINALESADKVVTHYKAFKEARELSERDVPLPQPKPPAAPVKPPVVVPAEPPVVAHAEPSFWDKLKAMLGVRA